MKSTNKLKLSSTHRVNQCVKNLNKELFIKNPFQVYKEIFDSINKTKNSREFTLAFIQRLLLINPNSIHAENILSYHKSRFKNYSKIDRALYDSISSIRKKAFLMKRSKIIKARQEKINIIISKNEITSDIYTNSSILSMKPIYNSSKY